MSTVAENYTPVWTTADGRQIPYPELEEDHLEAIINDGYRNVFLIEKCDKRGISLPDRRVDLLTDAEIMSYVESFASCALAGNGYALYMSELWEKDKPLFLFRLNEQLALQGNENS